MPESVVTYDKQLPEIKGRRPWESPTSYLVKDDGDPTGWREKKSGRRPSQLLLVPKLREEVEAWRADNYMGASTIAKRLLEYWFQEDHAISGFSAPFRYYFCQREAIETLIWLVEIANAKDVQALIKSHGTGHSGDLLGALNFQTTMEGQRKVLRHIPGTETPRTQELPPENLRRFAFKMATGSGKTWVMAMAIVWAHLHKRYVPNSDLSTNFLVVAPNVIVYQRLEKDFSSNRIFQKLPLIPPELKHGFRQKVILRGDTTEPSPSGNLFLTNIHQLYETNMEDTPKNAVDYLLGKKPAADVGKSGRSMLTRVKSLQDIVIINDEAHHVHRRDLAWSVSLAAIHRALPNGIGAWLDFSATPKDQNGMYFPWIIVDYPLAQAVEDRIVKVPLIVSKEDDPEQPSVDPDRVTKSNAVEKYRYWLLASTRRWKQHWQVYNKLKVKPVLFIMVETKAHADAIGKYLQETDEFGFRADEVLIIHTDAAGEITKRDLDKARQAARDIDDAKSNIKVIVSVMMLREGWDVRNVTVVLGLRPFTAKSEILPEQVIGRGLRMMTQVSQDRTQTLEVLGTRNLLDVLRTQLEADGVGIGSGSSDPIPPIIIEPVQERLKYDIALPLTKPRLRRNIKKLEDLNVRSLKEIFEVEQLDKPFRINLRMEFSATETVVHEEQLDSVPRTERGLIRSITNKVIKAARLTNKFAQLYPIVREYIECFCFGRRIDLHASYVRSHLGRIELQEGIAEYLAKEIAHLTTAETEVEFEREDFKLSKTKPFSWRRDLPPPLQLSKTVFNFVATYNNFERRFAEFLDEAEDVKRFAALGTTEQGESNSQFRVDYLKTSGAIGLYYPDWVVVQDVKGQEINWIIETKGRVWKETEEKDTAMTVWCKQVSDLTRHPWCYIRINQAEFDSLTENRLDDLCDEVVKLRRRDQSKIAPK